MRGKESGVSQECEQEIPYLLLTHFPNACNGQGWTGQAGSQVAGTQTSQGLHQQEAEGRSQSWECKSRPLLGDADLSTGS